MFFILPINYNAKVISITKKNIIENICFLSRKLEIKNCNSQIYIVKNTDKITFKQK